MPASSVSNSKGIDGHTAWPSVRTASYEAGFVPRSRTTSCEADLPAEGPAGNNNPVLPESVRVNWSAIFSHRLMGAPPVFFRRGSEMEIVSCNRRLLEGI